MMETKKTIFEKRASEMTIDEKLDIVKRHTRDCIQYDNPGSENIWEVLKSRDCRYHMSFDVYVPNEKDVEAVYIKIIEAADKITKEYWDKALVVNPTMTKVTLDEQ